MFYAYLRLSTDEKQQATSFDVQLKHITAKYSVDAVFKDTISGSVDFDKRPQWKELASNLKKGDTILVHKLDRFSRSTMNYLVAEAQLEKMGVNLIFVEGVSNDDTPEAQLMRTMISAFASFERSMIRTRIIQTKAHQKSLGKFLGGKIPYGYNVSDGDLVEDLQEQTIIKQMLKLREQGLSYSNVSRELSLLGYLTRKGKEFLNVQIQRVVKAQE